MSAPEGNTSTVSKTQRVLACVLCQQRKVKCDRKFPCKNCIGSRVQCIPAATLPQRPRRRRFPEKDLLDRVRHYETLLREKGIDFEPLHKDASNTDTKSHIVDGGDQDMREDGQPSPGVAPYYALSPSTTVKSESTTKPKSYWDVINSNSRGSDDDDNSDSSPDEVRENMVRKAWDQLHQSDDHALFGWYKTGIDISDLHPESIQIFRLWQVYVDNVNPLLKVTHTPTMQALIIEAASNVTNIKPTLTALMFGIYCMAVYSLDPDKCYTMFAASRDELLSRYQAGCQQALLNCGFLRSSDRDCLTALYFYLISIRPKTDPFSLSSMLGIAIRIAQRMGLHSESACSRYSVLEAEMRRRLWWSLMFYDTRICEMADYKTVSLTPIWDCNTPLNVNDSDLQPEMKGPPTIQTKPTEAIFAVVRGEVSDFVRHSSFHLDFVNPLLKSLAREPQVGLSPEFSELASLERIIEDKYLSYCNPEIPLQFMTIWATRGYLAKYSLFEHYARISTSPIPQTNSQSDAVVAHALRMLECDTMLTNSPLVKGYMWIVHLQFPFAAYLHIFQDLRKRPDSIYAKKTWEAASENFNAHFASIEPGDFIFFKIFAKIVLHAWSACEAVFSKSGDSVVAPRIVTEIKARVAQISGDEMGTDEDRGDRPSGGEFFNPGERVSRSINDDYGGSGEGGNGDGAFYGIGGQTFEALETMGYPYMGGQAVPDVHVDLSDWNAMDWNPMAGFF